MRFLFVLVISAGTLCDCTHPQPEHATRTAATFSEKPLAAETTDYTVKGLSAVAQIVVDRWGIPHIYAQTADDLFFAQGFNAARDRLWQLDLWRRQGEGKLAEAFGARFVKQDAAARLFLYRGNLDLEFASYHPRGKEILTAFTSGINAYVDLVNAQPELLPVEFKLTGSKPGYWSPTSPLIRIFGLTRNLNREVTFAQLVHLMGPEAVGKVLRFDPPTQLQVPKGVDLSLIDDKAIASYKLARGGVKFVPADLIGKLAPQQRVRWAQRLSVPPVDQRDHDDSFGAAAESNNWALSGKLTASGKPILAGDPHRAQNVPSLRYIAHLNGPGWNVIGAGEPALPGISLGHNERIAYALTIFSFADEEDLYVYETNPANPNQYLYRGNWEDMRLVGETIAVKAAAPATVTLKFTRHGPVLSEDPVHHKAYSLRAAYLEHEGTAPYLASLRVDQARNWDEFVKAMEAHYTPSENMAYADVDGNIGWFGGSIAAVRPNWNGLLPVAGNGDYEWEGFLDTKLLPRLFNPVNGFFASANQYNVPPGYAYTNVSAHEWAASYRFDRIIEVLTQGSRYSVADSAKLQYDDLSLPARQIVPLLSRLHSPDDDVAAALGQLQGWNYRLSTDSVAAAIYELWMMQLDRDVFALYVPAKARSIFGSGDRQRLIQLVASPDDAFGPDPQAARDVLLLQALSEAVAALKRKLGPDMSGWKWGKLHHMTYEHDLAIDAAKKPLFNVGPVSVPGDGFTVRNTGYRESDFNQNTGASYREVIDVADWDASTTLNSPGQSGDPNSRHYRDLFPLWAEGKFVPMLFSRQKVTDAAEKVYELHPTQKQATR